MYESWNSLDRRQLSRGVNERFLRLYSHKCIWPATYKTDHGHQESCAFSSGHGEKVQSSGWRHLAVSNLMGLMALCLWGFPMRTKCRCWFCTMGRTRKHCNPLRMSSSLHHLLIMVLFWTGLEYKSRLRWSFFFPGMVTHIGDAPWRTWQQASCINLEAVNDWLCVVEVCRHPSFSAQQWSRFTSMYSKGSLSLISKMDIDIATQILRYLSWFLRWRF